MLEMYLPGSLWMSSQKNKKESKGEETTCPESHTQLTQRCP